MGNWTDEQLTAAAERYDKWHRTFTVFCKINDFNGIPDSCGMLLEPVSKEWYGDKNAGLAGYLHDDEGAEYINSIHYYAYYGGYIGFDVEVAKGHERNEKVTINGEETTIKKLVCDYISGQISDGWGENGVYIIKSSWIGDTATRVTLGRNLYEKDLKKSRELGRKAGDDYSSFEDYPAYKPVEF